jgi:hypothetical protein
LPSAARFKTGILGQTATWCVASVVSAASVYSQVIESLFNVFLPEFANSPTGLRETWREPAQSQAFHRPDDKVVLSQAMIEDESQSLDDDPVFRLRPASRFFVSATFCFETCLTLPDEPLS